MDPHSRKTARKRNRCTRYISRETGLNFPSEPRKDLLICNAGLVSDLQSGQLLETFLPFGAVDNVVMLPGKSYCFVQFHDVSSAEKAFKTLDGKGSFPSSGVMYLAFSDGVPDCPNDWSATLPPGLLVIPNFINEEEENHLMALFESFRQETSSEKPLKNRDVQHFGFEFCYGSNDVDVSKPLSRGIPSECNFLWVSLQAHGIQVQPEQLTVNYYKPGQGIPRHVDTHSAFEEPILSLSLGSDIVMDWNGSDNQYVPLLLPRLSMLVMAGDARYGWTHGIVPRKSDIVPSAEGGLTIKPRGYRISLTFRKLRPERVCSCSFRKLCDLQRDEIKEDNASSSVSFLGDKEASEVETNHVHQVYEKIGSHFSETRSKPWPNVLDFVLSLPCGSILLDIGCGNGKYFGQRDTSMPPVFELGCDTSSSLADVCSSRGFHVMLSNCLTLPVRSNTVDACISIAVIHHLVTEPRRRRAVSEIIRVLRPGGRALLYVWARDQARGKSKSSYLKQDRRNRRNNVAAPAAAAGESSESNLDGNLTHLSLPVHTNRTQFQHSDVLVPWKLKHSSADHGSGSGSGPHPDVPSQKLSDTVDSPPTFLRFYHVFQEGELEALCTSVKGVRVQNSYYDQGNWCIIFEKTENDDNKI